MNENIKSDLFLELYALCDLLLVELNIFFPGLYALLEFLSVLSDIGSLRERTDRCRREQWQVKDLLLDLFALFENREPYIVAVSNSSDLSLDFLILCVLPAFEKALVLLVNITVFEVCAKE